MLCIRLLRCPACLQPSALDCNFPPTSFWSSPRGGATCSIAEVHNVYSGHTIHYSTLCTLYVLVISYMHGTFAAFSLQFQFALFAANYFECLHCGLIVVQHYLVQGGMRGREGSGLLFILTPLCSVWVRREGCLCLFSRVQFIVTPVHWCAIHECQWRVSVFSPECRL